MENLTFEQKQAYLEVVVNILGLSGVNITAENIDLEIATEIDNFIKDAQNCTRRISAVTNLFRSLFNIKKLTLSAVREIVNELRGKKISNIWASCYFVIKPKYTTIVSELFIKKDGSTGIIY